jgi:hypothetical protein
MGTIREGHRRLVRAVRNPSSPGLWGRVAQTGIAAAVVVLEWGRLEDGDRRASYPYTARSVDASSAHLKLNYWISARPLSVSRTSSPMTVMLSSRPTIRLVWPGIAPPSWRIRPGST